MTTRHRIRLAGPWEAEIVDSSSHHELVNVPLKAVLGVTGDSSNDPFRGNLKLRRNFNLPTGLDEQSVVWLCTEGFSRLPSHCQVFLNQHALDAKGSAQNADHQLEFAVSNTLEHFNRIEIVLSCAANEAPVQIAADSDGALVAASVWLEIE